MIPGGKSAVGGNWILAACWNPGKTISRSFKIDINRDEKPDQVVVKADTIEAFIETPSGEKVRLYEVKGRHMPAHHRLLYTSHPELPVSWIQGTTTFFAGDVVQWGKDSPTPRYIEGFYFYYDETSNSIYQITADFGDFYVWARSQIPLKELIKIAP